MNRYEVRKQFGKNPDLYAVLVWATQKALKGYRTTHTDSKRQRTTRLRDVAIHAARELKRAI